MLIVLIASLILLASLKFIRINFDNPASILVITWIVISFLNEITIIYEISIFCQVYISLCITAFTIGSLIPFSRTTKHEVKLPITDRAILIITLMLIVYFPFYVDDILRSVSYNFSDPLELRDAMTNAAKEGKLSLIISVGINIPIVLSFYLTCTLKKLGRNYVIFIIVCTAYVLLSLSKGYLILFTTLIITPIYIRGLVSRRHIQTALGVLFFLCITMFMIRDTTSEPHVLFKQYTVAPTSALDLVLAGNSPLNSPTYKFMLPFYELFNAPTHQINDEFWAETDVPTNVFTGFASTYNDFGLAISLVIFLVFGMISNKAYRMSFIQRDPINIFILSWMYYAVMTSFFSDSFIAILPSNVKYLGIIIAVDCILRPKRTTNLSDA
jgi:oligosaccharide repeat unit polymerase